MKPQLPKPQTVKPRHPPAPPPSKPTVAATPPSPKTRVDPKPAQPAVASPPPPPAATFHAFGPVITTPLPTPVGTAGPSGSTLGSERGLKVTFQEDRVSPYHPPTADIGGSGTEPERDDGLPKAAPPTTDQAHPHGSLPVHIADRIACDIISVGDLGRIGVISVLGGSHPYLHIGTRNIPLRTNGNDTFGDLILDPSLPPGTYTFADANNPDHAGLDRMPVLLDSGAQVSVLRTSARHLVQRPGTLAPTFISGLGKESTPTCLSGWLDLAFPSADLPRTRGMTVFMVRDEAPSCLRMFGTDHPAPWERDDLLRHLTDVTSAVAEGSGTPPPPGARPSAFPALRDSQTVADRFNIFDHGALRMYPGLVDGVSPYSVDRHRDPSRGLLSRALGKVAPTAHPLNAASRLLRDSYPPGCMWWTDISRAYPEDFNGDKYARLFSEERTGYARIAFSQTKTTGDLLSQLEDLERWVTGHVPGGTFQILRCDFGSEAVVQGRGDNIYVSALAAFCATRPGFRVIPVAPYSQAHNKAESTWGRIHGLAFLNSIRAHVGPAAWSLVQRGAVFQHNHVAAKRELEGGHIIRSTALTGEQFDASTMLGYVCQQGITLREDRKANAFRTATEPGLYLHPSEEASGQLFYNLRRNRIDIVRTVGFSQDPNALMEDLASSSLYQPRGVSGVPEDGVFSKRLRLVLAPDPASPYQCLELDPLTGLPNAAAGYTPAILDDGTLILARDIDAVSPPPELPAYMTWYQPPPVPDDAAHTANALGAAAGPRSADPLEATAGPLISDFSKTPEGASALAKYLLLPGNDMIPLSYRPEASKSGASGARFESYRTAKCVAEYRERQTAWRTAHHHEKSYLYPDLNWDILRGLVLVGPADARVPPDLATVHLVRTVDAAVTAALGIDRLAALEPQLVSGPVGADPPNLIPEPASLSECYTRGIRMVRTSLADDLLEDDTMPQHGLPYDPETHTPDPTFVRAIGAAALHVAPLTVRDAMRLPDYLAPNGWRAAINKEITRCERFKAFHLVPGSVVSQALRDHPGRVAIGYLVAVLTCKLDSAGDPRDPTILNKFRVAYADPARHTGQVVETFSSTVDSLSNVVITALAPSIGAEQTSIDVGGAYYHGTPPTVADGGRLVFAHVPYWLPGFGAGAYRRKDARGRKMYLMIPGNMPGRCDAGRIWQHRLDQFLLGWGLNRMTTDLRVFVRRLPVGDLMVHDHVDDSRLTSTTPAARALFHTAWALEFGEPPEMVDLTEDFTGLRHHRTGPMTTELSCEGVIRRLSALVDGLTLPRGTTWDAPLPEDAMRQLLRMARPSPDEQLHWAADLALTQKILGTIGFVVSTARPDAAFAYNALARYANTNAFTPLVLKYAHRVARYLLATIELHLTIHSPARTRLPSGGMGLDLFYVDVDSSHANGEDGRSYGGFVLLSTAEGGGAIAWKSILPREPVDSTGAAELRLCTHALKYVVAIRMLQSELDLGVAPTGPTTFATDAAAVVNGTALERVVRTSRWQAARYGMMRWGIETRSIELTKKDARIMVADILTKPLTGALFNTLRAAILGLPQEATTMVREDPSVGPKEPI